MAMSRYERLLAWNGDHFISLADIGKQLGMSPSGIRQALLRPEILRRYHEKLLSLGFPPELLPLPCEQRLRGRRKHAPVFPGLEAEAAQAKADKA